MSQISVIIPLYNEEDSLSELHASLTGTLGQIGKDYEIIFVDDGSSDGSAEKLQDIYKKDKHVKIIQFRKNYGKSAALSVGLLAARGKYVITIDADLQDDPEEIPKLLAKLEDGFDLVSGWRKVRHDPFIKRMTSKIYNYFTYLFGGIRLHDFNCGLKAYRSEVTRAIQVYGDLHRYIPVLAHQDGFRVSEVVVNHHERKYGKTKYGPARFMRGAFDLITVSFLTKYRKRPLHLFGTMGFISFMAGSIISLYLTYQKIILGQNLSNRPLLFLGSLLIIVGVQFFSIGLLGEMVSSSSREPEAYQIKKRLGF